MKRWEFVNFYANLPLKERNKPAVKLTYNEVWEMLEILKRQGEKK